MYLIVGLGNIGKQYEHTRHNVGFDVIDVLAKEYNISVNREKFKGEYGEGFVKDSKVILLKPSTYMNLSGESIIQYVNFYKIPKENIIVIYDDISLEVGRLRIRDKGSAGGHNGIKSIISHLSSDVFPRVKVGVGGPKNDLVSHVLGRFNSDEAKIMEKVFDVCSEAVAYIIKDSVVEAMNKFNGVKVE
ncbi:MAG: aminoacyl-tRNA hydrolase [Clostridiaceae bacterium]